MLTLTSPVETALHRVPAGRKLAVLALAVPGLMLLRDPWAVWGVAVAVAAVYLGFGLAFAGHGARMLRPLAPFLVIVALWHGWLGENAQGALIAGRLLVAVALANLLTMTTRLDDLTGVIERLATPFARLGLSRFGFSPRALAVAVALVVRFTPVLMDKVGALGQAWRARSPRRANGRIVLPAVLVALDDAEHVAEALRARGGLCGGLCGGL